MNPFEAFHRDLALELGQARGHVEAIREKYGIAFDLAHAALERIANCENLLDEMARLREEPNGR